ncbi:MAG TPA: hypothetical protein VGR57_13305 [Ktedonobacterales bacterium]|nr:hypothetical protein [Ktedonobacterales bacterium]
MNVTVPAHTVFISVGSGLAPGQEHFVAAIEATLRRHGLGAATLGRNLHSDGALDALHTLVRETIGTLVIAFARLRVVSAIERPDTVAAPVSARDLPTVWNQIEAAMAYQARKPLLLLLEAGLHPEGLLDPAIHPCVTFAAPGVASALPASLASALDQWIATLDQTGQVS